MPWSNQTGGGNANGGGNGGGGNTGGPWGQPPRGNPGGPRGPQRPGGGNQPPDLEEILRRGQDRLKKAFPGSRGGSGGGGGGGGGISFSPALLGAIGLAVVGLYVFTSAYQVDADELAVETVFGKPKNEIEGAGLNFAWWPFETTEKIRITERQINIGSTGREGSAQGLMLSGDQNIVDVAFSVLYSVDDPKNFLFNVSDPEGMVGEVAESAMREIVGRSTAQDVFRDDRQGIAEDVRAIAQETLNEYGAGIAIRSLNIEDVAPPTEVAAAFDEVQRAEQNEDQFQEEANQYRNKQLGAARGEAAQIREDAAGYKNRIVQEAEGEAQRFLSVYEQYAKAPEVTRKRLFLETMEDVLRDSNKIIMESGGNGGGTGVVPYLPLPEVQQRRSNNSNTSTEGNN